MVVIAVPMLAATSSSLIPCYKKRRLDYSFGRKRKRESSLLGNCAPRFKCRETEAVCGLGHGKSGELFGSPFQNISRLVQKLATL